MGRFTFGPVPSRRLGLSLGVNNVPYKHCSYSCVYCQAGRTTHLEVKRSFFQDPEELASEVVEAVDRLEVKPDFITFVPDGEPTLDACLGREAELIKSSVEVPLAVLSNSSLLWMEDVRSDLQVFDLVSLKVDAVSEDTWRRLNRPHPSLSLERVLEGVRIFADEYGGTLVVEVMLVEGLNAREEEYRRVAEFLRGVRADRVYLMVPTRPPAEEWVRAPSWDELARAREVFSEELGGDRVRLLASHEGPGFRLVGENFKDEVLRLIAVHPLRLDYFEELARERGLDAVRLLDELIDEGAVRIVEYGGLKFLIRSRGAPGA
ncbi:MAG: radical SAM protein [Thermoprotei archaeon]|nr:MAG: radical SAM protein [Thermoprotei archaeon]